MHRIQIQLTAEQERVLRELAKFRGLSISALIREQVDKLAAPELAERRDRKERLLSMLGKYNSGRGDVADRHDDSFVDAILAPRLQQESE
jgi:hypothetical protein